MLNFPIAKITSRTSCVHNIARILGVAFVCSSLCHASRVCVHLPVLAPLFVASFPFNFFFLILFLFPLQRPCRTFPLARSTPFVIRSFQSAVVKVSQFYVGKVFNSIAYQLFRNVAASVFSLNSFLPGEFRHLCLYGLCIYIRHVGTFMEPKQIRRSPYITSGSRQRWSSFSVMVIHHSCYQLAYSIVIFYINSRISVLLLPGEKSVQFASDVVPAQIR